MSGKTIATFALGAATGFVGCGIWIISKVVKSERIRNAIIKVGAEVAADYVCDSHPQRVTVSYHTFNSERAGDKQ